MSRELVAVLFALLVTLGLVVGDIPKTGDGLSGPISAEMGPSIEPGG